MKPMEETETQASTGGSPVALKPHGHDADAAAVEIERAVACLAKKIDVGAMVISATGHRGRFPVRWYLHKHGECESGNTFREAFEGLQEILSVPAKIAAEKRARAARLLAEAAEIERKAASGQ